MNVPTRIREYKLMVLIYRSQNTILYTSINPQTNDKVVIKLINSAKSPKSRLDLETNLALNLNHKYILKGYKYVDISGFRALIMPRAMDGDLSTWIAHRRITSLVTAAKIMFRVLLAIKFLHSLNILHGDIKTANILMMNSLTEDPHPAIIDFGFSTILSEGESCHCNLGTGPYAAPELLSYHPHSFPSDIYSLGITFYTLLHGQEPFPNVSVEFLRNIITTKKPTFSGGLFDNAPSSLILMIKSMLNIEPEKRPTASSLLHEKFFESILGADWIEKELEENKKNRCKDCPIISFF